MNQFEKKAKDVRDKVEAEFELEKGRKTQEFQVNLRKKKDHFEK